MERTIPGLRELHRMLLQADPLHEDLGTYAALLAPCPPDDQLQVCCHPKGLNQIHKSRHNARGLTLMISGVRIDSNRQKRLQTGASELPGIRSTKGVAPSVCGGQVPTPWDSRDVALLKLSLIQILVVKSDNLCIDPTVRSQYSRVLELLQQTGAHAAIVGLLSTSDKVLSHIASKCLSYLVLFQLKGQNEVNADWLQFCLKSLQQDPGSQSLVPCLTSLLSVCKAILTEEKLQNTDLLMKILVPLENVLEMFWSTFISYLSKSASRPAALNKEVNIQLSCLLDLIEALVALRVQLNFNVSLCKCVLTSIFPQALNIISSPIPYFLKKQIILVLKRCLLCKAAENLLPSSHVFSPQRDELSDKDLAVLAGIFLGAVQRGWLLEVPVSDRVSSFCGVTDASERGADLVILGAVSLSMLKALEVQVHYGAYSGAGQAPNLDLGTLMAHLLGFLKCHIPWKEPMHSCEWVSLIFTQQDDDMLEAAKCLLNMYQHNPSLCTPPLCDTSLWSCPSHECGCNPHCIFLFLISNLSFYSSVLLDFLISSETCFLEYFVRYLKLLKGDWPQFSLICTLFDKPSNFISPTVTIESEQSASVTPNPSGISLPDPPSPTAMDIGCPDSSTLQSSHTESLTPSVPAGSAISSLGALQRLVDYDSSEESEAEIAESSHCPVTGHLAGADSANRDKPLGNIELKASAAQTPDTQLRAETGGILACETHGIQQRAVQCLHNLQESIHRLHRKKLFPYNPSALLRLLSFVCNLSTGTHQLNHP